MKSNAKFYASLGLLILLNGIIKPIWIFGIDRQVQNIVGPYEYGTYFSLLNLSLVFTFLLDWGFTGYFSRQRAADPVNYISQAGNFLIIKIIFAVIFSFVVIACAWSTDITRWDIIGDLILIQILTYLFVFLRAVITAEQWFTTDAWLSVLDKGLMIILCGTVIIYPSLTGIMTIQKFLHLQILCSAIALFATFMILVKRKLALRPNNFSGFINKKLFWAAFPYALLLLLMSAHFRLDGFLLERIHPDGAAEAGIYAASYRLLDAANMIGFLFASFVLPYIARRWNRLGEINSVILNSRHFLLLFSIGVSCFVIFYSAWIDSLLYDHSGPGAARVMQWCLPALVGYSIVSIYGTAMTATGHIFPFCIITAIAVIINTALNLALIPTYGALGCCIAALASQTFCGIGCLLYVKQYLEVPFHWRSILIYIFIAAALSVHFYMAKNVSPVVTLVIAVSLTGAISWITGLFSFSRIKLLFNSKS